MNWQLGNLKLSCIKNNQIKKNNHGKTERRKKKRMRKWCRERKKESTMWQGVTSSNCIVWVMQQVILDGRKEPLLAVTTINFQSIVQASQHCNFILTWRGERVKFPCPFTASPAAWACLASELWKAGWQELAWDHNSFHRSKITSAVW